MRAHIKTAALGGAMVLAYAGALSVSTVDYVCKPYKPRATCEHGIYEIKIFEAEHLREPLGFLEAECIYDLGQRYRAVEVWFHTQSRTEFMEAAELPKKHIEICRVE